MKNLLLAFFTFVSACTISGQTDGLLWKVSGNGLKTSSYIFGTIHAYCHHENMRKPELQNAVAKSDVVAMEINLNDIQALLLYIQSGPLFKSTGKSLKKTLSPTEYRLVDSTCMALTGSDLSSMDTFSMIYVLNKLNTSEALVGCTPAIPVDLTIAGMAMENQKASIGFESLMFQDSLLSSVPESMQKKWLLEFCNDIPKAISEFRMLMAAYDAQSALKLYDLIMKSTPEMAYFNDVLLKQRNIKWAKFLTGNMKHKAYFVAVGAGHLGGQEGLINLLRKAGYTVTPVPIK